MKRALPFALLLVPPLLVTLAPRETQACTIDGKPTAFANGRQAVLSPPPRRWTEAAVRTYVQFSFPSAYRAHAAVHLTESRTLLRSVLPAQSLRHALEWEFGDGTHVTGWTVTHSYARPGVYRVLVKAYYNWLHRYYSFDMVRIVVAH